MALKLQQFAQARPSTTDAVGIYSLAERINSVVIASFVICNTTAQSARYRIFVDDDGTTYDETTALYYDKVIGANETHEHRPFLCMDKQTGNVAVRTDTANALTFTLSGIKL